MWTVTSCEGGIAPNRSMTGLAQLTQGEPISFAPSELGARVAGAEGDQRPVAERLGICGSGGRCRNLAIDVISSGTFRVHSR